MVAAAAAGGHAPSSAAATSLAEHFTLTDDILRKIFSNYLPLEYVHVSLEAPNVGCVEFKTVAKAVSAKERIESRGGWVEGLYVVMEFGKRETSSHLWVGR